MNNYSLFDVITIMSFFLGLENLQENREQSVHNDVQVANSKQAEFLLNEINRRFDEQNVILERQNMIIEKLLKLLGE